jgi:hypothetical protein
MFWREQMAIVRMQVDFEEENGKRQCLIGAPSPLTAPELGLMIADLVKHSGFAFAVDPEEVWAWVLLRRFLLLPRT